MIGRATFIALVTTLFNWMNSGFCHAFPDAPPRDAVSQFDIPLKDGRIEMRELAQELGNEIGLDLPPQLVQMDWTIDVNGLLGRSQLKAIERLANGAISIAIDPDRLSITIDRAAMHKSLLDAEEKTRQWIGANGSSNDAGDEYGLEYLGAESTKSFETPEHVVILAHGLDDPGFMWDDLIPHLREAGFQIAVFRYPNDGAISESADLLARTLEEQRKNGLRRIDVLAHSMGGLVARDVLTRPSHYAGDGGGGERFPAIDRLIMIGTPNHGAMLARYRFVTQAGEQLNRLINGKGLAPVEAGSGEAAVDLLPDSDFLRRLNSRPLARHTRYTNITSQWMTLDADRLQQRLEKAIDAFETQAPASEWRQWLSQFKAARAARKLQLACGSFGDGCVSVDSARLEGVDDFVVLRGNHMSVLWNGPLSDDVPPAVPIVLDRLRAPLMD
jgi:pimeloyl-ACP methyl ester carboxylesterase